MIGEHVLVREDELIVAEAACEKARGDFQAVTDLLGVPYAGGPRYCVTREEAVGMVRDLIRQRDAALAEVARMRAVVEAARALLSVCGVDSVHWTPRQIDRAHGLREALAALDAGVAP